MPNGIRHAYACGVIAGVSSATLLFTCGWQPALACSAGALAGIILTPDLDVDRGSRSNYYVRKFAGIVIETVWRLLWKPYAILVRHRSIWSHGPILSTVIRLLYISAIPALIWWWFEWPPPKVDVWMGWFLLGLVLSDTAHFLLDFADSRLGGKL